MDLSSLDVLTNNIGADYRGYVYVATAVTFFLAFLFVIILLKKLIKLFVLATIIGVVFYYGLYFPNIEKAKDGLNTRASLDKEYQKKYETLSSE